jgi:UDP-glucose 4-epimerase
MRVLLTGAAGFLGGRILALLRHRGFDVLPVARSGARTGDGFQWVRADLAEADLESCVTSDVDAICHVAARITLGERLEDLEACLRDNVLATTRLLQFALRRGIKRFVSTSTVGLYQRPTRQVPVTEAYPVAGSSFYAGSKLMKELALGAAGVRDNMSAFALRCSSIYGPGMRENSVLPVFVNQARRGLPIRIHGTGRRSQDFVYVDDVAEAHVVALQIPAPPGLTVCNVGSGVETTLTELGNTVIGVFSKSKGCLEYVPMSNEAEDRFFLDVTRLRRELGVVPIGLAEGLKRMNMALGEDVR